MTTYAIKPSTIEHTVMKHAMPMNFPNTNDTREMGVPNAEITYFFSTSRHMEKDPSTVEKTRSKNEIIEREREMESSCTWRIENKENVGTSKKRNNPAATSTCSTLSRRIESMVILIIMSNEFMMCSLKTEEAGYIGIPLF